MPPSLLQEALDERGFKKEDAFKMSFIISLPAIIGAIAFDILLGGENLFFNIEYMILIAVVAIVGFMMMESLLRLTKKIAFDKICYLLGIITIILVICYFIFI